MNKLSPIKPYHVGDYTLNYREAAPTAVDAIMCDGTVTTYAQLDAMVGDADAALRQMNLGRGAVVASWSPPCMELIVLQLAALAAGLRVIHIAPNHAADEVAGLLRSCEVRLAVVRASYQGIQYPALIRAMRPDLPHLQTVVVHGRQPRFEHVLQGGWAAFLLSAQANMRGADQAVNRVDTARVISGDIWFAVHGAPGGICSYTLNLRRVTAPDERCVGANDRLYLGIAPHTPVGMLSGCLSAIANGATIVLPNPAAKGDEDIGNLDMCGCSVALLPHVATDAEGLQRDGESGICGDIELPFTLGQANLLSVKAYESGSPSNALKER